MYESHPVCEDRENSMPETITLEPMLRETLESKAQQSNRTVNELLNDAIIYYLRSQDDEKLENEIIAYEKLHHELWMRHPMEWVAIHEQQLIDHDQDKVLLHRRIRERYPNVAVLMRQVRETPSEEIWIRTPSTGKIVS